MLTRLSKQLTTTFTRLHNQIPFSTNATKETVGKNLNARPNPIVTKKAGDFIDYSTKSQHASNTNYAIFLQQRYKPDANPVTAEQKRCFFSRKK